MTVARGRWAARAGVTLVVAGVLVPAPARVALAADTCSDQRTTPVYVPAVSVALKDMGYESVWRLATGKGVVVAVVDSGIEVGNAHLPAGSAVLPGKTYVPGVDGWSPDPTGRKDDLSGHGTAVASIIAGRGVTGSGQIGLAKDAQLLPMQVFALSDQQGDNDRDKALRPTTAALVRGIRDAADLGAKVINVSMSIDTPDPGLAAAVEYAGAHGALVVASAGDRGTATNKKDGPRYPAAFPTVLSVTAVTTARAVDTTNNVQGPHITVAAVGDGLNAAFGSKGDCLIAGPPATSFSTPLVSATAALVAQRYPSESPAMWKYRIESSALRPLADTKDTAIGWGIVSPYDALTMTLDPTRPGPTMPGQAAPPTKTQQEGVGPVEIAGDPNEKNRAIGIWIAFLAVAVAAGLRLVRVLRRGPEGDAA